MGTVSGFWVMSPLNPLTTFLAVLAVSRCADDRAHLLAIRAMAHPKWVAVPCFRMTADRLDSHLLYTDSLGL